MPRYNIEGIVLKSLNYKDTDRIYTIYSKSKGKISALAKGVRKISSKRSGNLDSLNHISLSITESTSGFKTINEVRSINSFKNLKRSLEKSAKGYYIIELLHKFTEENHENDQMYNLVLNTLINLNSTKNDPTAVLTYFEIMLMHNSGYGMILDKCAACSRVFSSDWLTPKFNYALGGLICGMCMGNGFPIAKETADFLNSLTIPGPQKFENASFSQQGSEVIRPYVEDILEDKIRSASIFKNVL